MYSEEEVLKKIENGLLSIIEGSYSKIFDDIYNLCFSDNGLIRNKKWIIKVRDKEYDEVGIQRIGSNIFCYIKSKTGIAIESDIFFLMNRFGNDMIKTMRGNRTKKKNLKKLILMVMGIDSNNLWRGIEVNHENYTIKFLYNNNSGENSMWYVYIGIKVNSYTNGLKNFVYLNLLFKEIKDCRSENIFNWYYRDGKNSYGELYNILLSDKFIIKFNEEIERAKEGIRKDEESIKKLSKELDIQITNKKLKMLIGR